MLSGMKGLRPIAAATVIGWAGLAHAASVYDDDFSDNAIGPQWTSVTDAGSVSLSESSGRLNVLTTGGTNLHDDALYLSNFRISTASDFTLQATYSFTATTPANVSAGGVLRSFGVDFGVGTDASGDYSAAIGQGFASLKNSLSGTVITLPGGAVASRNGGSATQVNTPLSTNVTAGTFVIHYDAAADDLTLSEVGAGSVDLGQIVRGTWHASDLLVSLGGRGDSEYAVTSGKAYFSQFTIVEGTAVPEPMGLALFAATTVLLRRHRP